MDPMSLTSTAVDHSHAASQGHIVPMPSSSSSSSSTSAAALSAVAGSSSSRIGVGNSSAFVLPKATKTAQDTLLNRTRAADLIANRTARDEIVRQKQLALAAHRGVLAARVPQPSGSADYSRGGAQRQQPLPSPFRSETLNLDGSKDDKSGFSCGGGAVSAQGPARGQPPVTPLATTDLGFASPYPDGALMSPESLSETRSLLTAVLVPRDSAPPEFTPNSSVQQMASVDGTLSPEAMPLPMDIGQQDSGSGGSSNPSLIDSPPRKMNSGNSAQKERMSNAHVSAPSSSEDFAEAFKYAVQADNAPTSTSRRQRHGGRTTRTSTAPPAASGGGAAAAMNGQMLRPSGDFSREVSSASAGRPGGASMVSGTNMKFSGNMASSASSNVIGGHSWSRTQWVNSVANAAAARTPGVVSPSASGAASWASAELGLVDAMYGDGDGHSNQNNRDEAEDEDNEEVAPRPISGMLRGARRNVPLALRGMRHQRQRSSRGVYGEEGEDDDGGSVGGGHGFDSSAPTWNAGVMPLLQDDYHPDEEPAAPGAAMVTQNGQEFGVGLGENGSARSPVRPPRSPPEPLGDLYTLAEGSMGSATVAEATLDAGGAISNGKGAGSSALPVVLPGFNSQPVASQPSRPGKRREPRGPSRASLSLSSAMADVSLNPKEEVNQGSSA